MTKKDYKIIADIISEHLAMADLVQFYTTKHIVNSLCTQFKIENENFNEETFLKACSLKK